MEYNTAREDLKIATYGRNIQNMISYVKTIEDKAKRTKLATNVVALMAQMNPNVKEQENYKQKLWNHLFYIADYELDIDTPVNITPKSEHLERPEPLNYPKKNPKYKHYGNIIAALIEKAKKTPEGPEKKAFTESIANLMKKAYLNWNRDSVNDQTIFDHLKELSGDALKTDDDFQLNHTSTFIINKNPYRKKRNNFSKNKNNRYRKSR